MEKRMEHEMDTGVWGLGLYGNILDTLGSW